MSFQKLSVFILGFAIAAVPAKATFTYSNSTTQTAVTIEATTDGLTVSSLIDFTTALMELASTSSINDEYVDATTGVEFLALNSTGGANDSFSPSSPAGAVPTGGLLKGNTLGDVIEVIFPSTVYGFAFNVTSSSFVQVCVDTSVATLANCASGGDSVNGGSSALISVFNDGGSLSPLPTLYIHPGSQSNSDALQSFEVASQAATPESASMILIGMGLVAIRALAVIRKRGAARL
jgi:hypothetical protein